ncbi:MAG: hypothetical protein V4594_21050 [Bacteroidota bacterium]
MKYIYILLLLAVSLSVNGQATLATFSKKTDKIPAGPAKEIDYKIVVTIPSAVNFPGYKINVAVDPNKTTLPLENILMPLVTVISVDKQTEDAIEIKIKRDASDDKTVGFKITAVDASGTDQTSMIGNKEMLVLVKPLSPEGLTKSDNILLYTGTNFDFIDGIRPKDLYFRFSGLLNMKNNDKETPWWLYINAGKDRFASAQDSVERMSYSDLDITKFHRDTVYLKNGFYKSAFDVVTDNFFTSFDVMRELNNSDNDKLFAVAELYIGYQSIRTKYKNKILTTQAVSAPRSVVGDTVKINPVVTDNTRHQVNYNIGFGLMYKQTNDTFDVRVSVIGGYNTSAYTSSVRRNATVGPDMLGPRQGISLRIRTEATLLNPLGVSLGFETLMRYQRVPIFSVSLTKVLSIKQLNTLLGSSAK